jgi:hypothetical protein
MAIRREEGPNGVRHSGKAIGLNAVITGLALALAVIAAQSPFF